MTVSSGNGFCIVRGRLEFAREEFKSFSRFHFNRAGKEVDTGGVEFGPGVHGQMGFGDDDDSAQTVGIEFMEYGLDDGRPDEPRGLFEDALKLLRCCRKIATLVIVDQQVLSEGAIRFRHGSLILRGHSLFAQEQEVIVHLETLSRRPLLFKKRGRLIGTGFDGLLDRWCVRGWVKRRSFALDCFPSGFLELLFRQLLLVLQSVFRRIVDLVTAALFAATTLALAAFLAASVFTPVGHADAAHVPACVIEFFRTAFVIADFVDHVVVAGSEA